MPRAEKGSKEAKEQMAKLRAMRGKKQTTNEPASNSSSKRLVKGSQEAKEHMAKLRAMRGKK